MSLLFAHHVALYHVPVLGTFFVVGCWLGWRLIARLMGDGGAAPRT
jgi:hypothetical protein